MKKILSLGLLIIACIAFTGCSLNNRSSHDGNEWYLNRISKLPIEKVEEIQLIDRRDGKYVINEIKNIDAKVKIMEFLNSLNLNDMDGYESDIQSNQILYEIVIVEKDYYPLGQINITNNSIGLNGKEYDFKEDIGKTFTSIYTSM